MNQSNEKKIALHVAEIEEAVNGQTEAIRQGDSRAGNEYAKRYIEAFRQLRAHGNEGRDALVPLLKHPRSDVRVLVASLLLRHRTQDSLAVLSKEALGQGIVAFGAKQAIKRWRDGTWELVTV